MYIRPPLKPRRRVRAWLDEGTAQTLLVTICLRLPE